MRRLSADGMLVGQDFQVNSYTTSQQSRPKVATTAQGDFVVVWDSDGSPRGALVSVYGLNLGATRGSSTLTVGGVTLSSASRGSTVGPRRSAGAASRSTSH